MAEKEVSEEEQRLCEEFLYLLDRGNTLLAGLRDLSDFGTSWETYFHRCFEIYARLWKFQQQHRCATRFGASSRSIYVISRVY
jgi:hypothetical protein